jgi:hypothetical protein
MGNARQGTGIYPETGGKSQPDYAVKASDKNEGEQAIKAVFKGFTHIENG